MKIKSITKLEFGHVYDLTVSGTHNFFVGEKEILTSNCDGLTADAQRALRNTMEEYSDNVRFILTANFRNRIIQPIQSRTQIFELVPPFDGCVKRIVEVIKKENVKVSAEQKDRLIKLIKSSFPDLRYIINSVQQYTINGELKIPEVITSTVFAKIVYDRICTGTSVNELRKYVIENEIDFNSDYLVLLKSLFEYIFTTDMTEEKKRNSMLIIGQYMESHQHVMDFEINAFCCLIQLAKVLS